MHMLHKLCRACQDMRMHCMVSSPAGLHVMLCEQNPGDRWAGVVAQLGQLHQLYSRQHVQLLRSICTHTGASCAAGCAGLTCAASCLPETESTLRECAAAKRVDSRRQAGSRAIAAVMRVRFKRRVCDPTLDLKGRQPGNVFKCSGQGHARHRNNEMSSCCCADSS